MQTIRTNFTALGVSFFALTMTVYLGYQLATGLVPPIL